MPADEQNDDALMDVTGGGSTNQIPETSASLKRKREDEFVTVHPDSKTTIVNAKRTQYEPDNDKKIKVLKSLISGHNAVLNMLIAIESNDECKGLIGTDLMVSNQIASIIFLTHSRLRQTAMERVGTNLMSKSEGTDLSVTFQGKTYVLNRETVDTAWKSVVATNGLKYEMFDSTNKDNWYGTIGPYLKIFVAFGMRYTEIRLGHDKFPVKKKDGVTTMNFVRSYGLNGAHHVLLEGITFAPETKSSMAQSLGPMTILLAMIRSEEEYRKKLEAAFKKAFLHIPHVNDIIEIVRHRKTAADLAPLVSVLGDLILITSARQNSRMCFPISMLSYAYEKKGQDWLKNFNVSGVGGYITYDICREVQWSIGGGMTNEEAQQVIFHSIFGTYKEDLSLLAQITNNANWYQRQMFGKDHLKNPNKEKAVKVQLIKLNYGSEWASANQTAMLTTASYQITHFPVFSGKGTIHYQKNFFEYLEKRDKINVSSGSKTIPQLVAIYSKLVHDLTEQILKAGSKHESGTTSWYRIENLKLGEVPLMTKETFDRKGKFFLGDSNL